MLNGTQKECKRVKDKEDNEMAVRPFYVDAEISGRKTNLAGGTARRDGEHRINIYQRDEGSITRPFYIEQYSKEEDGVHKLVTDVYHKGNKIATHITNY